MFLAVTSPGLHNETSQRDARSYSLRFKTQSSTQHTGSKHLCRSADLRGEEDRLWPQRRSVGDSCDLPPGGYSSQVVQPSAVALGCAIPVDSHRQEARPTRFEILDKYSRTRNGEERLRHRRALVRLLSCDESPQFIAKVSGLYGVALRHVGPRLAACATMARAVSGRICPTCKVNVMS